MAFSKPFDFFACPRFFDLVLRIQIQFSTVEISKNQNVTRSIDFKCDTGLLE
jgi:hypothetical protein